MVHITYPQDRLLNSKVLISLRDISYTVTDILEGLGYFPVDNDVNEYIANIIEPYLHTAPVSIDLATVDRSVMLMAFLWRNESVYDDLTIDAQSVDLASTIIEEMSYVLHDLGVEYVYDYSITGFKLAIVL